MLTAVRSARCLLVSLPCCTPYALQAPRLLSYVIAVRPARRTTVTIVGLSAVEHRSEYPICRDLLIKCVVAGLMISVIFRLAK